MDEYRQANRKSWDAMTPIHVASEFYDVEGFKRGRCALMDIDVREVGDVAGKRLLHLQCHFGQDTLSWARRGAEVVGVDFSEPAIVQARALATELSLNARFICCDLYDLPNHLDDRFDIVYTSAGVLCWLPDMPRWGQIAARYVKPGGFFYLRDFHPAGLVYDDSPGVTEPRVRYPYFHNAEPMRFETEQGTYADPTAELHRVSYEWHHSLADIINALINAGLRLEYLHEFPFTIDPSSPLFTARPGGGWHYAERPDSVPLMFSLKARA